MRDDETVGHHALELEHAEDAVNEWNGIDFEMTHTPVERRDRGGVVVNEKLVTERELLEVLRREEHSFVPLNRRRDFARRNLRPSLPPAATNGGH